ASTSCRGLAPCRLAASVTAGLLFACWIGAHGRNAICSISEVSTIDSDWRSAALYRFCTETTGVICCASCSCFSETFEIPMCRILPSSLSCTSAPTDSAYGTRGSGRWSWYSGIWSSRSRRPQAALAGRARVRGRAVGAPAAGARPDQAALGGDDQVVGVRVQGLGDQPLAALWAVGIGGVDEVDAEFPRPPQRGPGLVRVR